MPGCLVGLVSWLAAWLPGCWLVGWLVVGWLVGWIRYCLSVWLAGWRHCMCVGMWYDMVW